MSQLRVDNGLRFEALVMNELEQLGLRKIENERSQKLAPLWTNSSFDNEIEKEQAKVATWLAEKVVVDLGVELKRKLYAALALQRKSLKQWITEEAKKFTKTP